MSPPRQAIFAVPRNGEAAKTPDEKKSKVRFWLEVYAHPAFPNEGRDWAGWGEAPLTRTRGWGTMKSNQIAFNESGAERLDAPRSGSRKNAEVRLSAELRTLT